MKKIIVIMILMASVLMLCSCPLLLFMNLSTDVQTTDVKDYGDFDDAVKAPAYLPDSLDGYKVNSYSYNFLSSFECYEIFLDITVNEEQFQKILTEVNSDSRKKTVGEAYYAEGFYEMIFSDEYRMYPYVYEEVTAGLANIEKVIYNPETFEIVFVLFIAPQEGIYPVNDIAYFKRFGIKEEEYVKKHSIEI